MYISFFKGENMNKSELVKLISSRMTLNQKEVKEVIDTALDKIIEAVASGKEVSLLGFGTFVKKERASRKGINPVTREEILIPACKTPYFKASSAFKERVNK
ncbi:MAG: HU family DNA-binding protein [Succinivibrio sp.]